MDARYQFQPWYIKVYRQCRYKPKYILLAIWHEFRHGPKPYMWSIFMGEADIAMGHYYTMEEVLKSLSSPVDSGRDGPNIDE